MAGYRRRRAYTQLVCFRRAPVGMARLRCGDGHAQARETAWKQSFGTYGRHRWVGCVAAVSRPKGDVDGHGRLWGRSVQSFAEAIRNEFKASPSPHSCRSRPRRITRARDDDPPRIAPTALTMLRRLPGLGFDADRRRRSPGYRFGGETRPNGGGHSDSDAAKADRHRNVTEPGSAEP